MLQFRSTSCLWTELHFWSPYPDTCFWNCRSAKETKSKYIFCIKASSWHLQNKGVKVHIVLVDGQGVQAQLWYVMYMWNWKERLPNYWQKLIQNHMTSSCTWRMATNLFMWGSARHCMAISRQLLFWHKFLENWWSWDLESSHMLVAFFANKMINKNNTQYSGMLMLSKYHMWIRML